MTPTPSATPRPRTSPRRLVGLDGLRGLLALCVILVHVTAHFAPSVLAVTHVEVLGQAIVVFFVMSGFLIYYPFARALLDGRSPLERIGRYALARALRVFPAYLVIFLAANALGALYVENAMVVQDHGGGGGAGSITEPVPLLLHLSLLQNYVPGELQTGISSSWTLTVELAFYLLLPFLAALVGAAAARLPAALRRNRYAIAAIPGALLVLGGLGWRALGALAADGAGMSLETSEWGPNGVAVLSRSILPWSDNFGWGMLAAVLALAVRRGDLSSRGVLRVRALCWVGGVAAFVLSSACFFLAPRFIAAAFAVLSCALVLLIVLPADGVGRTWRVARLLDNPVFYWLGVTSLSIYLWHYPVMLVLERWGLTGGDSWGGWAWTLLLVTAVSTAAASLTYTLVERPALRLKLEARTTRKERV